MDSFHIDKSNNDTKKGKEKKKQFVKYLANVSYCFCTFFLHFPFLCSSFIEIVLFCVFYVIHFVFKAKDYIEFIQLFTNFKLEQKLPQSHRKMEEEQNNNNSNSN